MEKVNKIIKVSVIVPVYNSEASLKRCLDSILAQSLNEIEIIVINDGSTDNSINILSEYKDVYGDKIIIINLKERRGPGGARNEGILASSGEYIAFVDSDDDISSDMYKELYSIAKKCDYDMVDCSFYNEYANENMRTIGNDDLGNLTLDKKKNIILHTGFIWSKIIKRSIIIQNNIKFREKVIYEDIDFLKILVLYLKKVSATEKILYYYRNNNKSVTNSSSSIVQINQKISAMRSIVKEYKRLNKYDAYKDEITYIVYKTYMNLLDLAMSMGKIAISENVFFKLKNFFFEICDSSYNSNKYIKGIPQEQRIFAEVNNKDTNKLIQYANI